MRRSLLGVLIITALFATAAVVFAAGPPPDQTSSSGTSQKVKAFTDGEGNPVGREDIAGPKSSGPRSTAVMHRPEVRRGQAWWPYRTALPPYTLVGKRAEAMTEDEIQIDGVAMFNAKAPNAALERMPADLLLDAGSQLGREEGFYLVKIKGFTRNQAQVDALEAAGAVLGEYVNTNTYVAKIPTGAYAAVKALPFVTFVGDFHPAYKISPRIGLEQIPVDEVYDSVTGAMRPWAFELTLHKGADVQEVLSGLGLLGIYPQPERIVSNPELTVIEVEAAPESVPDLARIPGVKLIAEKTYPQLLASSSSPTAIPMILQNNGVFTTNTLTGWQLWNEGLDGSKSGSAQIITMMDTGLNTEMEHFAQDTTTVGTLGSSHRKVVGYDNYGGDVCVNGYLTADGGHGTWTSQHAAGSISNMTSNPDTTHTPTVNYDDGIARGAKIYFQDIGTSAG
ncbi:MAG: hypothetical protein LAO51_20445, partial [Acidobacteriia bacterium]|nr:hypothetical protein [Terriglobia bacterium]